MTENLLPPETLAKLAPDLVSPGLLALVHDEAPTRAILNAGAGHFATANITLTHGARIGGGADAAEQVIARWAEISDRTNEIVPEYGLAQAQQELAD